MLYSFLNAFFIVQFDGLILIFNMFMKFTHHTAGLIQRTQKRQNVALKWQKIT